MVERWNGYGSDSARYGYLNQVSPAAFAAYGSEPYTNAADNLLLGSALNSTAVISARGKHFALSGLCHQQHSAQCPAAVPAVQHDRRTNSPTGNTWYDSLQMKGTKRLSHGLQVNGTFTWSQSDGRESGPICSSNRRSLSSLRTSPSCSMPTGVHNTEVVQQSPAFDCGDKTGRLARSCNTAADCP